MSRNEKEQEAISLLHGAEFGILSTSSSDIVGGFPLGNPLMFVLSDKDEIIIIANDISEYRRNFAINEKVCFTILKQKNSKEQIIAGLNFFGKVRNISEDENATFRTIFIEKFPITEHLLIDETNKLYKIIPSKMRYFDAKEAFWIDVDEF